MPLQVLYLHPYPLSPPIHAPTVIVTFTLNKAAAHSVKLMDYNQHSVSVHLLMWDQKARLLIYEQNRPGLIVPVWFYLLSCQVGLSCLFCEPPQNKHRHYVSSVTPQPHMKARWEMWQLEQYQSLPPFPVAPKEPLMFPHNCLALWC